MIIPHYDFAKLLEEWDIQDDSIASNPLKMMGSPTRKFPEPIRAEEQTDPARVWSIRASKASRKSCWPAGLRCATNKAKQDVVFTGRIFTAKQAQENLLVDKLGFIEDAIERAVELAALNKDDVQVVKYTRPRGIMDQLLYGPQGRQPSLDLAAIAELGTPKAFYLCTWLPGLSSIAQSRIAWT